MISTDIENLKLTLIRICNEHGSIVLSKLDSNTLITCLQGFEDRVAAMEHSLVMPGSPPINDLTNIAFFPTPKNKGDAA